MKSSAIIPAVKLWGVAIFIAAPLWVFADGPKGLEGLAYLPVFLLMLLFNFLALATLPSRRRWLIALPAIAIALNLYWIFFYEERLDRLTEFLVYKGDEYNKKRTELLNFITVLAIAVILNVIFVIWRAFLMSKRMQKEGKLP